jgi:hypothetical protein
MATLRHAPCFSPICFLVSLVFFPRVCLLSLVFVHDVLPPTLQPPGSQAGESAADRRAVHWGVVADLRLPRVHRGFRLCRRRCRRPCLPARPLRVPGVSPPSFFCFHATLFVAGAEPLAYSLDASLLSVLLYELLAPLLLFDPKERPVAMQFLLLF